MGAGVVTLTQQRLAHTVLDDLADGLAPLDGTLRTSSSKWSSIVIVVRMHHSVAVMHHDAPGGAGTLLHL